MPARLPDIVLVASAVQLSSDQAATDKLKPAARTSSSSLEVIRLEAHPEAIVGHARRRPATPAPPWLSAAGLAAARRPPDAMPRLGDADSRAVRKAILAHHPSLSMPLVAEAVAYVLGSE